jgi:Late embryogenesis abundant protein
MASRGVKMRWEAVRAAGVSVGRSAVERIVRIARAGVASGAGRTRVAAALLALAAGCAALSPKPLPPRVTLEAVRVTRLTAAEARFTLALAVDNPNAYDLAVNAIDARLAVEGEPLLTASLAAPAVLAAGAVTRVLLDARTTPGAVAAALDRIARRPAVRYEVTGAAIVQDGWRLPFARRGELSAGDFPGRGR